MEKGKGAFKAYIINISENIIQYQDFDMQIIYSRREFKIMNLSSAWCKYHQRIWILLLL